MNGRMGVKAVIVSTAAFLLLAGAFFRFYHYSEQGFWGDEGATAHYVAGYSVADILAAFRNERILTAGQLYQFETVSAARGPRETIRSLALEDAGHPPLYYLLGQQWLRVIGGPPVQLRLLTAFLSLLLLPAVYWLAIELFGSSRTAWIAVCLVAVSPFWIEYAQQAREYSLWAALTAASSALLLRALRTNNASTWALYFVSVVLSLYCFLFAVFVVLAHLTFVCFTQHSRASRRSFVLFSLCVGAAAALYTPWLIAAARYMQSGWYTNPGTLNMHGYIHAWMVNLAAPFFDLEYIDARLFSVVLGLIVLIAWSFAHLVRHGTPREKVFVAGLAIAPLLVFASKSTMPDAVRYTVPTLLAVQLTVAFALGRLFDNRAISVRALAAAPLGALVVLGLSSCIVRSQQHTWWITQYGAGLQPIAAAVNRATHPLLVTDDWVIALDISPFLNPATQMELATGLPPRDFNSTKQSVFVYSRSTALPSRYAFEYHLVALGVVVPRRGSVIYSDMLHHRGNGSQGQAIETWLWRVTPKHHASLAQTFNRH